MRLLMIVHLLLLAAPAAAQVTRPAISEVVAQPATWVPFASTVLHNGVRVGRFWRDSQASTRLELDVPDDDGRSIVIHNIPRRRYYVYRPGRGWTSQPMVLPTTGFKPLPMTKADAGDAVAERVEGLPVLERHVMSRRERRAPALNLFPVLRELPDGATVETHTAIRLGEVEASLFAPPLEAVIEELVTPGGIVALPGVAR